MLEYSSLDGQGTKKHATDLCSKAGLSFVGLLQANYGGIRCSVPPSLRAMFGDGEAPDVEEALTPEGNEKQEVEMKWNLAQFLPEAASCQEIFKVVIASHIQVLHSHMVEEWRGHSPGTTPIRRRDGPSQSQVRVNDGRRSLACSV